MKIKINRKCINHLYTEGELLINGILQSFTVEATESMLPAGNYLMKLVAKSARKRELQIHIRLPDGKSKQVGIINIGHSWITARHFSSTSSLSLICIGQPLIPGVLCKATPDWNRINNRIKKCKARKEEMTLTISDTSAIQNAPIKHWLKHPSNPLNLLNPSNPSNPPNPLPPTVLHVAMLHR